ncbi:MULTISPECIES: hypothetical protein [Pseudomonas]|nr:MULTISPECIES: hypothetical protein [Pseudomonas]
MPERIKDGRFAGSAGNRKGDFYGRFRWGGLSTLTVPVGLAKVISSL